MKNFFWINFCIFVGFFFFVPNIHATTTPSVTINYPIDGISVNTGGWNNFSYTTSNASTCAYTWGSQGSSMDREWRSLAASSDGNIIYSFSRLGLYKSTDVGYTWSTTSQSVDSDPFAVASADGSKVFLTGNYFYRSVDGGKTWQNATSPYLPINYYMLSASSDGTVVAVIGAYSTRSNVYVSTDSGATFATSTTATTTTSSFSGLSVSPNGEQISMIKGRYLYISVDQGLTWTEYFLNWTPVGAVTYSSDSQEMYISGIDSGLRGIYKSEDNGQTWSKYSDAPTYGNILISSDKQKVLLHDSTNIYISSNGGQSWHLSKITKKYRSWRKVTMSSDGEKIFAVTLNNTNNYTDYVYSSEDGGSTWFTHKQSPHAFVNFSSCGATDNITPPLVDGTQDVLFVQATDGVSTTTDRVSFSYYFGTHNIHILSPLSSSDVLSWSPHVIWDGNNTGEITACEYSWNNTTWSPASCSGTGSDIGAPVLSNGSQTLYLRTKIDSAVNDTMSVTFYLKFPPAISLNLPSANGGYVNVSQWDSKTLSANEANSCSYSWSPYTSLTDKNIYSISMSDDGVKIVAVAPGATSSLYISTDSGVTWFKKDFAGKYDKVRISKDGRKMILGNINDFYSTSPYDLLISDDDGISWATTSLGAKYGSDFALSSDGSKIIFATKCDTGSSCTNGSIFMSNDGGMSWSTTTAGTAEWKRVVMSDDGINIFATPKNAATSYISTNGGSSWSPRTVYGSSFYAIGLTASENLSTIVSHDYNMVIVSTSTGSSWQKVYNYTAGAWLQSMNLNNQKLFMVHSMSPTPGSIFTSTDNGYTWSTTTSVSSRIWKSITSTLDGTKVAAGTISATSLSGIFTSTNAGLTWSAHYYAGGTALSSCANLSEISTPQPGQNTLYIKADNDYGSAISTTTFTYLPTGPVLQINSPSVLATTTWTPVIDWGSALHCSYSYDTVSYTTVDCTNNGADVAPPIDIGTTTLTIRGIDGADNVSTTTTTFYYDDAGPIITFAISGPRVTSWPQQISWGDAQICEYSYDGDSWNTVTCSSNGLDVSTPVLGSVSLMLRATDSYFNVSTSTKSFTFALPNQRSGGGTVTHSVPATATTIASLEKQISQLTILLDTLLKQSGVSSVRPIIISFSRDLQVGSRGGDVKALQSYLNSNGFLVAPNGPGSVGKETEYFGSATRSALKRFQIAKNIYPALGYFGLKTRTLIRASN